MRRVPRTDLRRRGAAPIDPTNPGGPRERAPDGPTQGARTLKPLLAHSPAVGRAVVRDLIDAGPSVHLPGGKHEGSGYLSALLNELVAGSGRTARGARRMMGIHPGEASVELPTERLRREEAARADVVVTSSGSLGHIYFAQIPDQLSLEQIAAVYPVLIEALVAHAGIGFVLLRSETRGAIALGKHGVRELDTDDAVQGEDPLAGFSSHTGGFLRRLARYANAGDIIVNGAYNPSTRQIIGIDDLVGAHGGVGGMQTQPFIVYPAEWTEREPELVGAASVHRFLRQHALGEEAPRDRTVERATVPGQERGA